MTTSSNVIARTNVISGAQDDDFALETDAEQVRLRTLDLVPSQIQNLHNAGLEILASPPDGLGYAILGVYSSKAASAYADGAAVTLNYTDDADTLVATIPVAHFTAAATDSRWATRPALSGAPNAQAIPAAGVEMSTSTGFTGDGGDITVTIRYVLVKL